MSCLAFTSFTSYFVCPARDQVRDRFCSCSPMYLSRLAKRCGFTFFLDPCRACTVMSCHVMTTHNKNDNNYDLKSKIHHVYAYGRKTVRAFCFFLEYCSLSWGWGGVGWGGMLTFLVLRTWSIAMLLRSLGSLTTWHVATLLRSLVWVGVGWGGGAC